MAQMYELRAKFHPENDAFGHRICNRIRFTALRGKDVVGSCDIDVTANPIDGTIVVLLLQAGSSNDTAIRANQALKHGESVELGMHDSDTLIELGFHELKA
jgi:hypothetical protein